MSAIAQFEAGFGGDGRRLGGELHSRLGETSNQAAIEFDLVHGQNRSPRAEEICMVMELSFVVVARRCRRRRRRLVFWF